MNPANTIGEGWQPIETAPDLDRVLVAGWQPPHGRTQGYWWWAEDTAYNGQAVEHPNATIWCAVVKPPFPNPPASAQLPADAPYPGRGHSTSPRTSSE